MNNPLSIYYIFGNWSKGAPDCMLKMVLLAFSEKNAHNAALAYARQEFGELLDETKLYHSVRAALVEPLPTGEARVLDCRPTG